jgi:hypothetical protein
VNGTDSASCSLTGADFEGVEILKVLLPENKSCFGLRHFLS